jgi:type IV pilus assembly protein PilM
MAKTIVGLEITEESVRAVEVTAGDRPVLIASGEVALPWGAARDSEVLDQDAVALALRQLWSRGGFHSRRVVLGIGSRRVLVREFATQTVRPDLLAHSLPAEVQHLLPVPASQAVLDFLPIAEAEGKTSGLLVAAVSQTVSTLLATLRKARLRADAVDFAPFGLARAAGTLAHHGETLAMVHIGDHTSYVVIVRDGVPLFVRILPIDIPTAASIARADDHAVAEGTDVAAQIPAPVVVTPANGESEADPDATVIDVYEALAARVDEVAPLGRVRLGAGADGPGSPVAAPVPMAAADIASRVRSTFAFHESRSDDAPAIDRVLLSGAGAASPGVFDAIDDAVDMEVVPVEAGDLVSMGSAVLPGGDVARDLVSTIGLVLAQEAA